MLESGRELQNHVLVHKGKGLPGTKGKNKFSLPAINAEGAKEEGEKIRDMRKLNTRT